MKIDLKKFSGVLPYASELFGIYQPLLGWKSKRIVDRLTLGLQRAQVQMLESMLRKVYPDAQVLIRDFNADNVFFEIPTLQVGSTRPPALTRLPPAFRTLTTDNIDATIRQNHMNRDDDGIWRQLVSADALAANLDHVKQQFIDRRQDLVRGWLPPEFDTATFNFSANSAVVTSILNDRINLESMVAGALKLLFDQKRFDLLRDVFFPPEPTVDLQMLADLSSAADPLETFDPKADIGRVSLSPVGMVHLFRQYFFEFDTFLGPPVQHIWLSPGSTLELVEVHTRKQLVERTIESLLETTVKSEKSLTEEDELSDAVRAENQSNTKFGMSINVGTSMSGGVPGIYSANGHVDTTTSYNVDENRKTASEVAHKHMRQQSDKLSSEIKKSFKSSFKTVSETQDLSSRRYVLANTTTSLINYELRRKMRQVGVQVQDIGTQLCWQTFVDLPGAALGIAALVHIAEPPDLTALPPPEAPAIPQPITKDYTAHLLFQGWVGDNDTNNTYVEHGSGSDEGWAVSDGAGNDKIHMNYPDFSVETVPGYELAQVIYDSCVEGKSVDPDFYNLSANKFSLHLKRVNFDGNAITLKVRLIYVPDPTTVNALKAKYQADLDKYDEEKRRLQKEAFIKAARDRIKMASNIEPRKFDELREEERTIIYRHLIGGLLNVGVPLDNAQTRHILAELINSMFDVDKMLYFVAPEWWLPRMHKQNQQNVGGQPANLFKSEDMVSWGGAQSNYRPNYYITEDSLPAKLGSSLGWLLQLDGDNLRNAFLNAPWVKAVIPLRPGKELAALNWLMKAHVEGADGLDAQYQASATELNEIVTLLESYPWDEGEFRTRYTAFAAKIAADPQHVFVSLRDALISLSLRIKAKAEASRKAVQENVDGQTDSYLATDKVFEKGFDPLIGGFRAADSKSFEVFDTWIEVLPTDQIAAVPVEYDPKTGLQK